MNDRRRERRLFAGLLATVISLVLVAAGLVMVGLSAGRGAPVAPAASTSGPASEPAPSGTQAPPSAAATPPPTAPEGDRPQGDVGAALPRPDGRGVQPGRSGPGPAPVSLDIPAIGVAESTLTTLGTNPDETVEVPADFARAGWFELGPSPGEVGSAVILGHVDSFRGPAVFFRLRDLRPGDRVEVGLADGSTARFVVTAVETYPKEQFPARRVYASTGSRDLQLVTCGGEFDRGTGHYLANVVVYTSLVDTVAAV